MTSNQSESFNAVLKRLHSWKQVPLDAIVLSLYHLQTFYLNEVERGFAGIGSFTLVPELNLAKRSFEDIVIIPTFQVEKIIEKIQQKNMSDVAIIKNQEFIDVTSD